MINKDSKNKSLDQFPIAIAEDKAFHFLYPEIKECLEKLGIPFINWQPIEDQPIPEEARKLEDKNYKVISKGMWSKSCKKKLYVLGNRPGSSSMYKPSKNGFNLYDFKKKDLSLFDVSKEIDLFQITFLRGLIVTLILLVFCFIMKVSLKIPNNKDKIIILVRSVFEVLMIYSFLTALFNMNIANANAVLQLIPLVVLFGSFLFCISGYLANSKTQSK